MIASLKTALFSLFVFGLFLPTNAQDDIIPNEGKYWTIGFGIPITTVRDKAHSPLAYRGTHFRIFTAFERVQAKQVYRTQISLNVGSLKPYIKPKRSRGTNASLTDLNVTTAYYRKINGDDNNPFGQFIGGGFTFFFNSRDYSLPSNNTSGFLGAFALQANFMDKRTAFDKADWTATSTVSFPLVAKIFRPTYIGLPDVVNVQKPGFKTIMKSMEWVTINRFFYLNASIDFDRVIKPWRAEQYGYTWSLLHTSLPKYKSLTSVTGALNYGFKYLN